MSAQNQTSVPTGFVPVPEDVRRLRTSTVVVNMGPPKGVSDDECGTIEVLIETNALNRPIGRGQYAYYRPTAEELEQLNAGGVIELGQYGQVFQPVSLRTWPPPAPADEHPSDLLGREDGS